MDGFLWQAESEMAEYSTADCPVRECAQQTVALGQDLEKALRRLRKTMRACARCGLAGDCALIREWHSQIDAAVREVAAEWGLP